MDNKPIIIDAEEETDFIYNALIKKGIYDIDKKTILFITDCNMLFVKSFLGDDVWYVENVAKFILDKGSSELKRIAKKELDIEIDEIPFITEDQIVMILDIDDDFFEEKGLNDHRFDDLSFN